MHAHPETLSVLTIAGSDSGGGAGIQADLKTFAAFGVHGLSAIVALTAQNTQGVTAIELPSPAFVRAQIDACFDDFNVAAIKIGMLADATTAQTVADALRSRDARPLVLDPVMIATSGARLLESDAIEVIRTRLIPMAQVVTPNVPELSALTGIAIEDAVALEQAAHVLLDAGAQAVMAKGAHLMEGDTIVDRLFTRSGQWHFEHSRLPVEGHGTGCSFASAIAAQLALGKSLSDACAGASDFVAHALNTGYAPGRAPLRVLRHISRPSS